MKLEELKSTSIVLEGEQQTIYEALLPLLVVETADGVVAGDGQPGDVSTSPGAGWGHGPFRPGGGMNGNHWFNEFYRTIKNLVITKKVLSRMKEIGIDDAGQKRVQQAAKNAAKQVNDLLMNPRATAYKIPVWTFDKPKTPVIKRWNEGFAHEFKRELSKLNELKEMK